MLLNYYDKSSQFFDFAFFCDKNKLSRTGKSGTIVPLWNFRSQQFKITGGDTPAIIIDIEGDALAVEEFSDTDFFELGNMDEDVFDFAVWSNKAIAFFCSQTI